MIKLKLPMSMLQDMLRDAALSQMAFAKGPAPSECIVEIGIEQGARAELRLLHPETQQILVTQVRSN